MAQGNSTAQRAVEDRADSFEKRIGALATIIAARFARGNAGIQQGRGLTEARLEAERDARTQKSRKR